MRERRRLAGIPTGDAEAAAVATAVGDPATWLDTRGLAPVVDPAKHGVSPVEDIENALSMGRKMRRGREGNNLRVSDLVGKCVRAQAIGLSLGMGKRQQALSLGDQVTFAQGDAIHDVVKSVFGDKMRERIWGKWECKCGSLRHDTPILLSDTDEDEECPYCLSKCDRYEEVTLVHPHMPIEGHPDVLFWYKELEALQVHEVKSKEHNAWVALARPEPVHEQQVSMYWMLARALGYKVLKHPTISYHTKSWTFDTKDRKSFKVFEVDAAAVLGRMRNEMLRAAEYKEFLVGGASLSKLPTRTCASIEDTKAKECNVCITCFAAD